MESSMIVSNLRQLSLQVASLACLTLFAGVERAARHQLNPRRSFLPPSILHDSQQDIGTGMPGLGRDDAFRIVRVAGLIGLRHSEQGYVGRRVTDDARDVCELEFGHGV